MSPIHIETIQISTKGNPQIRIVKRINARRSQFEVPEFQLLYKSYTNKREYKRGLLIITSPLGGITLTHTAYGTAPGR